MHGKRGHHDEMLVTQELFGVRSKNEQKQPEFLKINPNGR
jgi:glutathione S-transferase